MPHPNKRNYFAQDFGQSNRLIGIAPGDRRFHVYTIGRTGVGKSTLLFNQIVQDMRAGRGIGLIDPHGDLAQSLLPFVPQDRQSDFVYLNPADFDYPVGFNILERSKDTQPHLIAAQVLSVFRKLWSDSWGPRMEYLLRNCLLLLLDYPHSTLLHLVKLFNDEKFREQAIERCRDPMVKGYWQEEFANYPTRLIPEIISPVQNKIGAYLSNKPLRHILSQTHNRLNILHLMNNQGILVANLSKGLVGEDAANLLGSLLITQIQLSAMQRSKIPEDKRQDFYLYVDEFHNFTTSSFADILSEARKFRLNLTISNQGLFQLNETVQSAVLANVGTLIIFRVGPEDALKLAREFGPEWPWNNLLNLNPHEVYYKLLNNGIVEKPKLGTTLPPPQVNITDPDRYVEKLIASSRRCYAVPRQTIERKIKRFLRPTHKK